MGSKRRTTSTFIDQRIGGGDKSVMGRLVTGYTLLSSNSFSTFMTRREGKEERTKSIIV